MVTIPPPVDGPPDTEARARNRAALAAVLWAPDGRRRLPTEAELSAALDACGDDVWWVCEASSAGPTYLLPTAEWIEALAAVIDGLGAKTVLEVACGDGFLSACLAERRPALTITATDDGSWDRASGRMTDDDRVIAPETTFAGIRAGAHVERRAARDAVDALRPDVVIVAWAPPGVLVEDVIEGQSLHVIDIGVDGEICGNGMDTWRFNKDFLDGPVETLALCRLDSRPRVERHSRVTHYFGSRHPEHGVEDL